MVVMDLKELKVKKVETKEAETDKGTSEKHVVVLEGVKSDGAEVKVTIVSSDQLTGLDINKIFDLKVTSPQKTLTVN